MANRPREAVNHGNNILDAPGIFGHGGAGAIGALVCGYSKKNRRLKLLAMLTVFADESASDIEDRRLFLAGLVHSAMAWADFSDRWEKELSNAPRIDYFHAVEAESLRGQFFGWSKEDRNIKVLKLSRTIEESSAWSVVCSLSVSSFNQTVSRVAPYDMQDPYSILFYMFMETVFAWHRAKNINLPIDFVFDENNQKVRVMLRYDFVRDASEERFKRLIGSTPIFRDDKQVLPLQAADLFAWHVRRMSEERNRDENRPAWDVLREVSGAEVRLEHHHLQELSRRLGEIDGLGSLRGKKAWRKQMGEICKEVNRRK